MKGGVHTTAVDVLSVGNLIQEWDTQSVWDISLQGASYLRRLLSPNPNERPTAEEALNMLKELRLISLIEGM